MILLITLLLVGGVALIGCSGTPINRQTVEKMEVDSLLGRWYEIARFDHSFERGLSEVETRYTLDDKGFIVVENSGYDNKRGGRRVTVGRAKTTRDPGRLRVSFFWIFYSDYNILECDMQQGWMLIGSRSARYLWILARRPQLPPATLDHILSLARQRGYDTDLLIMRDEQ